MKFIERARGTQIPLQARRVLFCYNKNNETRIRDKIISELLSMDAGMDCVVTYLANPEECINAAELRDAMHEMQLLVLWVTVTMLQSVSGGTPLLELEIAQELHIPVLPIFDNDGLFEIYKEKIGSYHGICRSFNTEYKIDLKTQLEKHLASDVLIDQIQANAFTASIFVAYRKVEITKLRDFLKVFHDINGFDTISVFYDNFLTAGRNFDDELKEAIERSNAFTMMVTPHLSTKGNYVQIEEYPFAQKKRKPIVPVEINKTDKALFFELFPGTRHLIPITDIGELRAAFCEVLGESAVLDEIGDARAYLLGMGYLRGIGVERDFDRAVKLLEAAARSRSIAGINAINQLADIYLNGRGTLIDYAQALKWSEKAKDYYEDVLGNENPDTGSSYNNIALIYSKQGVYPKALEWYQKALVNCEKVLGKEHLSTAATYYNIAGVYAEQGDYTKALEWYQKALVIHEKVLGKEHHITAATYNNIALIYSKQGVYPKALEWFQKALVNCEKVLGKEHPSTAATYNNIAGVYSRQGANTNALEWFQKALVILENVLGKEHPSTATTYNNIAGVYEDQGDFTKALEWYQRALVILKNVLGKEHPYIATTYNNIAMVYSNKSDYSKALEWNQKALFIREKVLDKEHPSIATTYNNIAGVYAEQGDYTKALEWYQKALVILEKVLGKEHPHTALIYGSIAWVYLNKGDYPKALEWYAMSIPRFVFCFGSEDYKTKALINNAWESFRKYGGSKRKYSKWLDSITRKVSN